MEKITLHDDNTNFECIIKTNNKTIEKIIKDKTNIMELLNIGKCEINNNILTVILYNNEINTYYLINEMYYNKKYIHTYFKCIKIKIDNNIFNSVLYEENTIYIPDFLNIKGKYELINDILIIVWSNGVIFFHIKSTIENQEVYIKHDIGDFDITFYKKQVIENENIVDWLSAVRHWYIYGRVNNIPSNHKGKLNMNNTIDNIIINHSHEHIYNIDKKIYYKVKFLDNNFISINTNFFVFVENSVIFNSNNNKNITFGINNNVYEEAVMGTLIHPEYIETFNLDVSKNLLIVKNNEYNYKFVKNGIVIKINKIYEYFYKLNNTGNENTYMKTNINMNFEKSNKLTFYSNNTDIMDIYNGWFDNNNNNCYTITGIKLGGSIKYVDDLKRNYINKNFIIVNSKEMLRSIKFKQGEIMFIQHLFFTNIDISDIIYLCKRNKLKLIISVHDWYWVNEKVLYEFDNKCEWENNYLKTNIKINDKILKLFDMADEIICPSNFVYNKYLEYFKNCNLKIVYHNDCIISQDTKYIPEIKNNTINIGNLNSFSYYKGNDIIDYLKNNITTYKNYNIKFLINSINLKSYDEFEYYDIVVNENIHCLTYLNNYAETYCYSLSKGLNIGSPIIYNNIGAFIERIQKKEHYFKIKYTENDDKYKYYEVLKKKFYSMLDYVIENNGKFLKYNNSNNFITYNKYYDNLFKSQNEYNVVMITSKVYTSNNTFSYTNNRSVYSVQERFSQTIDTINSIKKYIPNYYIILFDNSDFTNEESGILNSSVDFFINIKNDDEINYYTNKCKIKALAELTQLRIILKYMAVLTINIKNVFKISGRYSIVENFNYEQYDNDLNIFKKNKDVRDREFYYTSFYKISYKNISLFNTCIKNSIDFIKKENKPYELETILPSKLNYNFNEVDVLGVNQVIAVHRGISRI